MKLCKPFSLLFVFFFVVFSHFQDTIVFESVCGYWLCFYVEPSRPGVAVFGEL